MIDARVIELSLKQPWTIARGTTTTKRSVIVTLTRGAHVAYGEASPVSRFRETVETVLESIQKIGPVVEGDTRYFQAASAKIGKAVKKNFAAKAAVDMALYDLVAKELGMPVHRLFGLDPKKMPLTSFTLGMAEPEAMEAKVKDAEAYPVLKVKLGAANDREIFKAVRRATKKCLRVDANEGWKNKEDALDRIRELRGAGVELVEQPMPAGDVEGARWLYERSSLPIIADEAARNADDIPKLAGAYHGVNVKIQKCGGIWEAMRMIAAARAHGMKVMLGCMIETSLGIAAAAQIAPLADWLDLDGNLLLAADPYRGHPVINGRIVLNEKPGLGVEPLA